MDFRQLRYFVLVAEELHVGRAAEKLGIAQPALSQQIKALETRLGVRLFLHRKRGIELSEAGAAFLEETRRTLAQNDRAEHIARRMGRAEIGSLHIGYSGSVIFEPLLIELLTAFRKDVPEVQVSLCDGSVHAQIQALLEQTREVAFIRGPLPKLDEDLIAITFVSRKLMIALPAADAVAHGPEIDLALLAGGSLLTVHDPPGMGLAQAIRDLATLHGLTVRDDIQVDDLFSVLSMVSAGMGFSLVPGVLQTLAWPGVTFHDIAGYDDSGRPQTEISLVRRRDLVSLVSQRFLDAARRLASG